jgi:hypothetical protein
MPSWILWLSPVVVAPLPPDGALPHPRKKPNRQVRPKEPTA